MYKTASLLSVILFSSVLQAQQFSIVREHYPSFSNAGQYGACTELGDLTGDGVSEYGVADIDRSSQIDIFDGATGALYLSIPGSDDLFGMAGCSHSDINGDGILEFAIGNSENDSLGSNAGRVLIYSGADGTLLRTIGGPASTAVDQGFGWFLESFVDVNGDGFDEFIAGAVKGGTGGHYSGSVTCVDGATGTHIYTVHGAGQYDYSARIGPYGPDLNGDGIPEFAIGGRESYASSGDGYLRIVSGADGALLLTINGWGVQEDEFGESHAWVDDLDGDGFEDIVITAPGQELYGADVGRVGVFSSSTGALIREIFPPPGVMKWFGRAINSRLVPLPDSDGDGYSEVLISAYEFDDAGTLCSAVFVCSPVTGSSLYTLKGPVGVVTGFGNSMELLDPPSQGTARILIGGSELGMAFVYDFVGLDLDSDDDGLFDLDEVSSLGTDPNKFDTDGDGLGDGMELGVSVGTPDTDPAVFIPDADPNTTTNPLLADSDAGGVPDGTEDQNRDGRWDTWETDPSNPADDSPAFYVSNLAPGEVVRFNAYGADPRQLLVPAYSTRGPGPTPLGIGVTVALSAPIQLLPTARANVDGSANWNGPRVPTDVQLGMPLWLQMVEIPFTGALPRVSNAILLPVGAN